MKRILSAVLLLCIMITLSGTAFADQTQKAAVFELYSVDGYYQDSLGISQTILIMNNLCASRIMITF